MEETLRYQNSTIAEIWNDNEQLRLETEALRENVRLLETQSKVFSAALEELENRFLEMKPCAC